MKNATTKSPAFQFYPQDFLTSLTVQTMSPEEVGAYCLLLFNSWIQSPQATLPNNEDLLRVLCRLSPEQWERSRGKILSKFVESDCGEYIYNPRLFAEKERQDEYRAKMRKNGRKGGRPPKNKNQKVSKEKPKGKQKESKGKAKANQNKSPSTSTSTSTSISFSKKIIKKIEGGFGSFILQDEDLKEVLSEYWSVRKKKKMITTATVGDRVLKKLVDYSNGEKHLVQEMLENAINGGWKDIYPPKKVAQKNQKQTNGNTSGKPNLENIEY